MSSTRITEQMVEIEIAAGLVLQGTLTVPHLHCEPDPFLRGISTPSAQHVKQGLVIFVHSRSGSRRHPYNHYIAQLLQQAGLATLLIDLLTREEESIDRETCLFRCDIALLAERLAGAVTWLAGQPETRRLRAGLLGFNTGAGAALAAAAQHHDLVHAVVLRGDHLHRAGSALFRIQAPTLLIVGDGGGPANASGKQALAQMPPEKRLEIVPGAAHLCNEPGALESVAILAQSWFTRFLA